MDHWDFYALLRARNSDPLRKWADMEGKSPTMSEDLYQSHIPPRVPRPKFLDLPAASAKLVAAAIHAWLRDSR